jgi:hypothetical protein
MSCPQCFVYQHGPTKVMLALFFFSLLVPICFCVFVGWRHVLQLVGLLAGLIVFSIAQVLTQTVLFIIHG